MTRCSRRNIAKIKCNSALKKINNCKTRRRLETGSEALKLALKLERPRAFLRVASQMTMERGEKGMQIAKGVFKELDTELGAIAQVYSRLEHKLENERRGEQF